MSLDVRAERSASADSNVLQMILRGQACQYGGTSTGNVSGLTSTPSSTGLTSTPSSSGYTGSVSPVSTVKEVMAAAEAGDIDAQVNLCVPALCDRMREVLEVMAQGGTQSFSNVKMVVTSDLETTAEVTVTCDVKAMVEEQTVELGQHRASYWLQKVDGHWLVSNWLPPAPSAAKPSCC